MSKNNDRSTTLSHTSQDGNTQINLTTYTDSKGKENYVTQFKQNGKEIFHTTKHPDGTVNFTTSDGRKKIR